LSSSAPGNRQRPRGVKRRNQYPPTRGQTSLPQPRHFSGPTSTASQKGISHPRLLEHRRY
jgi:hypothetical protein